MEFRLEHMNLDNFVDTMLSDVVSFDNIGNLTHHIRFGVSQRRKLWPEHGRLCALDPVACT